MPTCRACGQELKGAPSFCPHCGSPQQPDSDKTMVGVPVMPQDHVPVHGDAAPTVPTADANKTMVGVPFAPQDHVPVHADAAPADAAPTVPTADANKTMVGVPFAPQDHAPVHADATPRFSPDDANKTMVGVPFAPQDHAPVHADATPRFSPDDANKTMVGVPFAPQDHAPGHADATPRVSPADANKTMVGAPIAPQDGDRTMVGVPMVSPRRAGAPGDSFDANKTMVGLPVGGGDENSGDDTLIGGHLFAPTSAPEPEPDVDPEPEVTTPAPEVAAAPGPQPAPPTEPLMLAREQEEPTSAFIVPSRALPDLAPYSWKPEDLRAPAAPAGSLGAAGYALKTRGLGGRLRKSLAHAEKRLTALQEARDQLLVDIGRRAWEDGISTPALAQQRNAIEAARAQSDDLSEQIAAVERAFAEERLRVQHETEARNTRIALLERRHQAQDQEYQARARLHSEAAGVLKETERRIAALTKSLDKLQATPDEKRNKPETLERITEVERELSELQDQLPELQKTVEARTQARDEQREVVAGLRTEIRELRAASADAERELNRRQDEVEGQKQSLRGEIEAAHEGMRAPLSRAAEELLADRTKAPDFAGLFASIDEHDRALVREVGIEKQYRNVAALLRGDIARRGWLLLGGAFLATAAAVAVIVAVFAGVFDRVGVADEVLAQAFPTEIDAFLVGDAEAWEISPLRRRLEEANVPLVPTGGFARDLLTAGDEAGFAPTALALGLRFREAGVDTIQAAAGPVDLGKLTTNLSAAGFEERRTDTGLPLFVKSNAQAVADAGFLARAEGEAVSLLRAAPAVHPGANGAAANVSLTRLRARIDDQAALWGVWRLSDVVPRRLLAPGLSLEAGDGVAISVDVSNGLDLRLFVATPSEERADAIEKTLLETRESARGQLSTLTTTFPALAQHSGDIEEALGGISVERSADGVLVTASLSLSLIDEILKEIGPLLRELPI